jgi:hypothetical protein
MPVDVDASEQFALANAPLLDRHRLAVLLHGAPMAPVLQTLRASANADGGFGHGSGALVLFLAGSVEVSIQGSASAPLL